MRIHAVIRRTALLLLLASGLVPSHLAVAQPFAQQPAAFAVRQADGAYQAGDVLVGGPGGHYVDAYGNPAIIPASYHSPAGGGYYGGVDPFGGAGLNVEQSGPHYFDISGEFIYWERGNLGSRVVDISADGVSSTLATATANIVQTTDAVQQGFQPGFRIFGRYDVGALSLLEVGYTGLLNQTANSSVTSPVAAGTPDGLGDLFSPFSNFGQDPFPFGILNNDLETFEETDRALTHALSLDTNLQTAEVNYRRYWGGYNPRLSGTLLAGFRYTRLDEQFVFSSIGGDFNPGDTAGTVPFGVSTATFQVSADNDLAGFQLGGDATYVIRQGIRLQTEGKVGIFNNDIDVQTTFATSDDNPAPFTEAFSNNQVAFITDARLTLIVDVLPSVSIKAGYDVLFLNSIATAVDNINFTGIPAGVTGIGARVPAFADESDAVFHGAHIGLEYIW